MGNFVLRYTQYTIYLSSSNKTSKPTGLPYLCEANPLVTGRFPAQSARFTESVPMPWRHHGMEICIWELLSWSNHKIHLFGKLPDWLYLMSIHGDCITQWHTPCLLTMFEDDAFQVLNFTFMDIYRLSCQHVCILSCVWSDQYMMFSQIT